MCKRQCQNCGNIEHLVCIYMGMGCKTIFIKRCDKCSPMIKPRNFPKEDDSYRGTDEDRPKLNLVQRR